MMRRQEVLDTLAANREALQAMGVASLALFGSVARDEAGATSDVDLLFEYRRPFGLFQYARVQQFLERILGVKQVDLISHKAVVPALRDRIQGEAIRVL